MRHFLDVFSLVFGSLGIALLVAIALVVSSPPALAQTRGQGGGGACAGNNCETGGCEWTFDIPHCSEDANACDPVTNPGTCSGCSCNPNIILEQCVCSVAT